MDLNPQFFDEMTSRYKDERIAERQRQQHRDVAWEHLRENVLRDNKDTAILPANINTPMPPMEVADISLMEDDYSLEGDEQMSMEGPSLVMDERMEEGDQHQEMVSCASARLKGYINEVFVDLLLVIQQQFANTNQRQAPQRGDHVRRKSVIPISADVMRE